LSSTDIIRTRIWQEEAEPDNPFATRVARCHGYDVYGAMLGRARWVDMLFLLFRGEAPDASQAALLEALAVALANPGPRDPSVHAAMCGSVGRSPAASCLMAALAVGAGHLSGGHEIVLGMEGWAACGVDLAAWQKRLTEGPPPVPGGLWEPPEHAPGFDPYGVSATLVVQQTLACLRALSPGACLPFLETQRAALEQAAGCPLALSGIAAAALADLGFSPAEGEMLYLLLRLPGAAAHALEQRARGYQQFPFGDITLEAAPAQEPL
jgi:citrate synthase